MSILDHLLSLPVGVRSCMLNVVIAILEILAVWWLTSVGCELDDDKKYISLNLILKIHVPGICEPQEDTLVNMISSVRKDIACEQDAMVLLAAFGLCPNPVELLLCRKHETVLWTHATFYLILYHSSFPGFASEALACLLFPELYNPSSAEGVCLCLFPLFSHTFTICSLSFSFRFLSKCHGKGHVKLPYLK